MKISVLVVIAVFLFLRIIYIIYSVKVAEVDNGLLDEDFDKDAFAKPAGWKIGKLPPELQNHRKVVLKPSGSGHNSSVVDNMVERWKVNELSSLKKSGLEK